jgi:hypothetical protein
MVHDPLFAAPFSFRLRRLPRMLPVLARDTRLTLTTTGAVAAHPIKIPARAAAPAQIASIHAVWHTAPHCTTARSVFSRTRAGNIFFALFVLVSWLIEGLKIRHFFSNTKHVHFMQRISVFNSHFCFFQIHKCARRCCF